MEIHLDGLMKMEVGLYPFTKFYSFPIEAYLGYLEYSLTETLPTEASVECDWGDESTPFTGLLDEMESTNDTGVLRYLIEHAYEEHGEYNVTCR